MSEGKGDTIIVIKKKVMGGGHHGGAWKVAYADFVTAMMAFFMVMWLMGSSSDVKNAVAGYFSDPKGFGDKNGTGMAGVGAALTVNKDNLDKLKEQIERAVMEMPEFENLKDQVKMTVTGEGLRIELMETEKGMFFESGSPAPSNQGTEMLASIAKELGKMENSVLIEGHTDSKPINREGYSNWELSGDRANAARRIMQANGLRPDQVKQVRGFADQNLMKKEDPGAAGNRRVSIIVQYKVKPPEEEAEDPEPEAHGKQSPKKDAHGKQSPKKDPHGKPDAKHEAKPDAKHEAKPDAKHEAKSDHAPEATQKAAKKKPKKAKPDPEAKH
jgi:chemotaxis protein MotB